MPEFEHDIFVSYWHKNNEDPSGKERGWVDVFQNRLRARLLDQLGREIDIWRDPRLPGNVSIKRDLTDKIKRSVALVSIVSPGYVNSDWCMWELREFRRLAPENGGLALNRDSRIFRVGKIAEPSGRKNPDFGGSRGYEFYAEDPTRKVPIEFDWLEEPYGGKQYRDLLSELVRDLVDLLRRARPELLDNRARRAIFDTGTVDPKKPSVYVAEATSDLKAQRDKLARELLDRGYDVRPRGDLPYRSPEYEESVSADLAACKMSVHMVGSTYGLIPEGAGHKSIIRIQHELAVAQAGQSMLSRIIWGPENLEVREEAQQRFLDELKASPDAGMNAEFLQTPLDELKEHVLRRLAAPLPAQARAGATTKKVYLIFNSNDAPDIAPVKEYLDRCGFDVELPILEPGNDSERAIELHYRYLVECDGALIYYGKAGQVWFQYQKGELDKRPGLVATMREQARHSGWSDFIYVTNPDTVDKKLFSTPKALFVKHFGPFQPELLKPFVESLRT